MTAYPAGRTRRPFFFCRRALRGSLFGRRLFRRFYFRKFPGLVFAIHIIPYLQARAVFLAHAHDIQHPARQLGARGFPSAEPPSRIPWGPAAPTFPSASPCASSFRKNGS